MKKLYYLGLVGLSCLSISTVKAAAQPLQAVQEDITLLNEEIQKLEQSVSKPLLTEKEFDYSKSRIDFLSFLTKDRIPMKSEIKRGFIDRLQQLKDGLANRSKRHEAWLLRWQDDVEDDIRRYEDDPKMNPARLERALTTPTKKRMVHFPSKYKPIIRKIHKKVREVLGHEALPETSIPAEEQKLLGDFTKEYLEFDLSDFDDLDLDNWRETAQQALRKLKKSITTDEGIRQAVRLGVELRDRIEEARSASS